MRPVRAAATFVLLASATGLAAPALPPAPERWVTDQAGFLSEGTRASLDLRLGSYERSSGHQVLVWIDKTLGRESLEEWAARTFAAWGVGRKGLDDGVAIFLFADDRKVRIEVGYGLEDRVTDYAASRIIRERMVPRLQAGDRDGAITGAVDGVLAAIGGEGAASGAAEKEPAVGQRRTGTGSLVLFGILAAIFLFILITNPSLAVYLLMSMGSGGRGSGWGGGGGGWGAGGGGGGFSGGGGRSGGGGASGSW